MISFHISDDVDSINCRFVGSQPGQRSEDDPTVPDQGSRGAFGGDQFHAGGQVAGDLDIFPCLFGFSGLLRLVECLSICRRLIAGNYSAATFELCVCLR